MVSGQSDPENDPIDRHIKEAMPAMASFLCGKLRLHNSGEDPVFACTDLFSKNSFDNHLNPYFSRLQEVDRRAQVSMWLLYYLSALCIVPIALWLKQRRILPLEQDSVSVVLSQEDGLPKAFILIDDGHIEPDADLFGAMSQIYRHIHKTANYLAATEGISEKLVWCNAAVYIDWIIRECAGGSGNPEGEALFTRKTLPSGTPNPLFNMVRRIDHEGTATSVRKICCLRYLIPGVAGCGMLCPLPQGRN